MTSMEAKSGIEPLRAYYDAAGKGKDLISVVDIGINTGIQVPEGAPVNVWSRAGAVTVMVGNNSWAGGDNRVNLGLPTEVPKATLSVDGKTLVQDGKLASATMATR